MSTRQTHNWYSLTHPSDANGRPNQMTTKSVSAWRTTSSSMPVPYSAPWRRGQAGARVIAAEQALDADQREHPENPSAALAEAYAEHSASYDLRTSMIDDFLESKREKPPLRKKTAKKSRKRQPRGAEDYFGYESTGSKAASSVSEEHSSEDSQEELLAGRMPLPPRQCKPPRSPRPRGILPWESRLRGGEAGAARRRATIIQRSGADGRLQLL